MGFWIFMLIFDLFIPLIMIGFGKYFSKTAPREINGLFGYRTSMSMKNKDTWDFAHHLCGKLWVPIGWIMLMLSVIAMLLVIGKDTDTIGYFGSVFCIAQLIVLISSIFPVEHALKKTFDKDGNRRL